MSSNNKVRLIKSRTFPNCSGKKNTRLARSSRVKKKQLQRLQISTETKTQGNVLFLDFYLLGSKFQSKNQERNHTRLNNWELGSVTINDDVLSQPANNVLWQAHHGVCVVELKLASC